MIYRSIRKAAFALLLAFTLALSTLPAQAFGWPGRSRPLEDSRPTPDRGFFSFLLSLFAPSRGTMDPNGGG